MTQFACSPTKAFPVGASAIDRYLRVKTAAGLVVAGASDVEIGVIERRVEANAEAGSVILRSAYGTTPMIAAGAISQDGDVYAAASGKVAATGTVKLGKALTAASADGDMIEVIRCEDTVLQSDGMLLVPSFANATRGAAGTAGRVIFNTDDGQLNIDDGTNWTLPDGTTT